MEITGKVKLIGDTETFGSKGFRKRELVITTKEQYPQHILIEFVQDKTELLDKYELGETLKVSINIRGREWVNPQGETKYFNSLQGWKIESIGQIPGSGKFPLVTAKEAFRPATGLNGGYDDDLPF